MFCTKAHNDATVSLQSYTGGAYRTAAQLIAGRLAADYFRVPRVIDASPVRASVFYEDATDTFWIYSTTRSTWEPH